MYVLSTEHFVNITLSNLSMGRQMIFLNFVFITVFFYNPLALCPQMLISFAPRKVNKNLHLEQMVP